MGERRGSRLAARLRAGIVANKQAAADAMAEKKAREAAGRAERKQLLEDLAAFGQAVGHLDVTVGTDVLILGLGEQSLRFEAQGIADRVRVKGLDPEPRLFLHPELDRWVVSRETAKGREVQELLFDEGLERMVAEAFSVTPAEEGAAEIPAGDSAPAAPDDVERTL
jgi:hypothetical protein